MSGEPIAIQVEIPGDLQQELATFVESTPTWRQDRVIANALALFLLHEGGSCAVPARVYLETRFGTDGDHSAC